MSLSEAGDAVGPQQIRGYVRKVFFKGLTIVVPIFVTVLVLFFAFDFLTGLLDPLELLIQSSLGLNTDGPAYIDQVLALVALGGVIFLVGVLAESEYGNGSIERRVESALVTVPGIGSLYESVHEISDRLLASDTASFQEVKLVEFPNAESYSLAFVTAETPTVVAEATGHEEMTTVFMPMAPNPVMGGYVMHIPENRVYDVDMSVEEGIKAIVSSGVAENAPDDASPGAVSRSTAGDDR